MNPTRSYLGDGIYAEFEYGRVTLTTKRHGEPQVIALEPAVLYALDLYVTALGLLPRRPRVPLEDAEDQFG